MRKTRRLALPALALALVASGCSSEKICSVDQAKCADTCTSLQSDALNCGACGTKCASGEACSLGACVPCGANGEGCKADVLAACFNANQVRAFDSSLAPVGAPVATAKGPGGFASLAGATYVLDVTGGAVQQVTPTTAADVVSIPGGSYNDLEHMGAHDGLLYVSNAAAGSFAAVDPAAKRIVDEVSLVVSNDAPNPLGFDFANGKAYIALSAGAGSSPNGVAVVDLSTAPPWATMPSVKRIDLSRFAFSAQVSPGASRVLAAADGTRVFVTLNNLFDSSYAPVAGANGKLVVIDTATDTVVGDAAVELPGCKNPSGMALSGNTIWIACGYIVYDASFHAAAVDGALQPVDVSGATPVAGTPIPVANHAIGAVAICGGRGYASTSDSGTILSFDPASHAVSATNESACPADSSGYAAVFDVACAL
jgi:hypothetical protein